MKKISIYISICIFSVLAILFFGCGDADSPYVAAEPAAEIKATLKLLSTAYSEYTTVFGTNMTSTDTAVPLLCNEDNYTPLSGDTPLEDYLVTTNELVYLYSGYDPADANTGRRYPNIGTRTGEEPFMNMMADMLLYYVRSNYWNALSASSTYGQEYLSQIRVASYGGGSMKATKGVQTLITKALLADGESASAVHDLIKYNTSKPVIFKVSTATLKRFLEFAVSSQKYPDGTSAGSASDGYFQHFSGLAFTYDRNNPHYSYSSGEIQDEGQRVRDIWLMKVPAFDPINDAYDSGLATALNNAHDSIQILANGSVVIDTTIIMTCLNFDFNSAENQAALGMTGESDEKILYSESSKTQADIVNDIINDENYTLYVRLQGRIRAITGQTVTLTDVASSISIVDDNGAVAAGETVTANCTFTVTDPDMNNDASNQEAYEAITIINQTKGTVEVVWLLEAGTDTKVFTGTVNLDTSDVAAVSGNSILIKYQDPYYSSDKQNVAVTRE